MIELNFIFFLDDSWWNVYFFPIFLKVYYYFLLFNSRGFHLFVFCFLFCCCSMNGNLIHTHLIKHGASISNNPDMVFIWAINVIWINIQPIQFSAVKKQPYLAPIYHLCMTICCFMISKCIKFDINKCMSRFLFRFSI